MGILGRYEEIVKAAAGTASLWLLAKMLFGLLNCFLGYKLLKFWMAGCGFLTGLLGVFIGGHFFIDNTKVVWIAAICCGVVTGVLAYEVYLVGVFLLGWLMTVSAVFSVRNFIEVNDRMKILMLALGAVLGILVGVLLVRYARPGIILSTGISGGVSVAEGITGLAKWENPMYMVGISAALAVCGIIFQWRTTKKFASDK